MFWSGYIILHFSQQPVAGSYYSACPAVFGDVRALDLGHPIDMLYFLLF